ncbi:2-dehydro-3-deoxy-6-phosphogalactonate aldolase [Gallibacterium anatis]|uniref:2-dehydro-3-deoxy-6-phosphogalactonate aldolase n=2 Tax=Gallibacterium anatis TaxID=750 RepID=U1I8U2_9PAST|nr:enolase C-terminal domain-like protein [Gallibacterium anatis]ERF78674.1 2-dehydro-3-deoxy-6-phosphogalactonate aldolase [Gallibacterium anatis 12656/12]KGQ31301.1 2-dehydro-3-deoxy-6-phosphogalactonate aldolase [Gallibacterium anatis]KGQ38803.1 2-dehydro-3-deoxy-6-phosphogalactonate aldolase [Gallibacterium anatis]KGQ48609.1 2-dehydro-3-deoxy-6-phosphogalactonate aldolase [Gallibacterium anatis]
MLKITNVKVILTAPGGIDLVVVKVETSENGLYGLGCATFTQRIFAVKEAIEQYIAPFVIGKDPSRIEDIWQSAAVSGYWRNGPVMNNALSAIDMALWDIKGKVAGLPVYDLLGGKCRDAIPLYRHCDGADEVQVEENIREAMEQGYQYVRCQMGMYGGAGTDDLKLINTYLAKAKNLNLKRSPENKTPGIYFDPDAYVRSLPKLFEHIRNKIGFGVELIHDVHERIQPIAAIQLAKNVEEYQLFYLEDPVSPENVDWLKILRQQTSTPIAMGELFVNVNEYKQLITNHFIDYIRCHVSTIGGITPAKKLAILSELHGVRTAWHGPGDISPIGVAANLHLDMSSTNLGIQEWTPMSDALYEVFPGAPTMNKGYAYLSDKPGLGVDINEKEAAKYPVNGGIPSWTLARTPDGTAVKP